MSFFGNINKKDKIFTANPTDDINANKFIQINDNSNIEISDIKLDNAFNNGLTGATLVSDNNATIKPLGNNKIAYIYRDFDDTDQTYKLYVQVIRINSNSYTYGYVTTIADYGTSDSILYDYAVNISEEKLLVCYSTYLGDASSRYCVIIELNKANTNDTMIIGIPFLLESTDDSLQRSKDITCCIIDENTAVIYDSGGEFEIGQWIVTFDIRDNAITKKSTKIIYNTLPSGTIHGFSVVKKGNYLFLVRSGRYLSYPNDYSHLFIFKISEDNTISYVTMKDIDSPFTVGTDSFFVTDDFIITCISGDWDYNTFYSNICIIKFDVYTESFTTPDFIKTKLSNITTVNYNNRSQIQKLSDNIFMIVRRFHSSYFIYGDRYIKFLYIDDDTLEASYLTEEFTSPEVNTISQLINIGNNRIAVFSTPAIDSHNTVVSYNINLDKKELSFITEETQSGTEKNIPLGNVVSGFSNLIVGETYYKKDSGGISPHSQSNRKAFGVAITTDSMIII
jgi:hypothetical protein